MEMEDEKKPQTKLAEDDYLSEDQYEITNGDIDSGDFDIIAGSSMGGLAAANASALRPDATFGLLLIAPAFGLAEMWHERLTTSEMSDWEKNDAYAYQGFELDISLAWDFMQTAERMSWPKLNHPTVILHGIQDDVVPIENSRRVASDDENVIALMELEDGHRMQNAKGHFAKAAEICLDESKHD